MAAAFLPARPQGPAPPWGGISSDLSDLRGVLPRRHWLQPLQLVEDVIYAGSLLGIQCHHGEQQALQGSRVSEARTVRGGSA